MEKILCPFCLKKFDNKKAKLICRDTARKCRRASTTEYCEYWGLSKDNPSAIRPHVYDGGWSLWGPAKIKPCPICGDDAPFYVCPHCHNKLPYDMVQYGTDIIPIIGGPAVGKTCYIVALLNQLNKYGYKINLVSSFSSMWGNESAKTFKEMESRLFKDHQLLEKTAPRDDGKSAPWFIKIENKNARKKVRPTYLIFYDIAGEQFMDAQTMSRLAAPVHHASGAIVLLDALDIPQVQKVMKEAGIIDYENHFSISQTINELLCLSSEEATRQVLKDRPIAFAFSKSDVIDQFRSSLGTFGETIDMKQNSNFVSPRFGLNNYRKTHFIQFLNECKQMDAGFKMALRECGMEELVGNNKWAEDNICFFGISALGQAPETDFTIQTENITPYRVLDPLIWILHKLDKLEIPE